MISLSSAINTLWTIDGRLLIRLAVVLLLLPTIPEMARAGGRLVLEADTVALPGGKAEAVTLVIEPDQRRGRLRATRVVVADQSMAEFDLRCDRLRVTAEQIGCTGVATFSMAAGAFSVSVTGAYTVPSGRMDLALSTDHAGGKVQGEVSLEGDSLSGTFGFQDLRFTELSAGLVEGLTVGEGTLSGSGRLSQAASEDALTVDLQLTVEALGFDNADGTIAAASLSMQAGGQVLLGADEQRFSISLAPTAGEVLLDSLYLNFAEANPTLSLRGTLSDEAVEVAAGRLADGEILQLAFSGRADLSKLDTDLGQWRVELERVVLPQAYERYLANFVQGTGIGAFEMAGQVRGGLTLDGLSPAHLTIDFREVSIADQAGRFAISGLEGLVDYDAQGDSSDSQLAWKSAQVYRVDLGEGEARFLVAGASFALLDQLQISVFDGGLSVQALAFADYGADEMTLDFEADIQPISLRPVTEALGWPPLNGTLSGAIPRVRLREQVVEVGGAIDLDVFDGTVRLEKLRLERLFGVLPTLAGDVIMENLDLQQMTGAFSFGEIRGRIGGGLRNLRLLDWEPVAFDMTLQTPPGDTSTHRISQRAVENLTSIGGGPTAVLSETFLRFFDDFGYKQLGLSCRLQNNVCEMRGVKPAQNGGYYIVVGSGIPRIDVIGYSREVDFPQLIRRVEAATAAGSPTFD